MMKNSTSLKNEPARTFGVFLTLLDSGLVGSGEVTHAEQMLYSGTDPESYITQYTGLFEEKLGVAHPENQAYRGTSLIRKRPHP